MKSAIQGRHTERWQHFGSNYCSVTYQKHGKLSIAVGQGIFNLKIAILKKHEKYGNPIPIHTIRILLLLATGSGGSASHVVEKPIWKAARCDRTQYRAREVNGFSVFLKVLPLRPQSQCRYCKTFCQIKISILQECCRYPVPSCFSNPFPHIG